MTIEVEVELPIVGVTFPKAMTMSAVDEYFEKLYAIAAESRYAIISDLRQAGAPDAEIRRYFFKQAVEYHDSEAHAAIISEAMVVSSRIMRGVITAYRWFVPKQAYPSRVFTSYDEAVAWTMRAIDEGSTEDGSANSSS